jgi:predicted transcriptional regulator
MQDPIDDQLLLMVHERASITEMSERVGRSLANVHGRLENLQAQGLVVPPPNPHQARSRELTKEAIDYLKANGYLSIQEDIFRR